MRLPGALVFDFDGLLLETEVPTYQSWAETYEEHGQVLSLEQWSLTIGRVDHVDPWEELQRRVGRALDPADAVERDARLDEARDPNAGHTGLGLAIVREIVAAHGGTVLQREGDALFVTFADPSSAILGAIDGQVALARSTWPADSHVRVRMGIHVGEVTINDDDD